MNTLSFSFGEFETVFRGPSFYFIKASLKSEFYILHTFWFIKDTEVIYIQGRVDIVNTLDNVIDFDIK